MKMNLKSIAQVASFLIALGSRTATAQSNYDIVASRSSIMRLSGISNLRNWSMNTGTFSGSARFNFAPGVTGRLQSVGILAFSLPVLNLKSHNRLMDQDAYKALKTETYKNILFRLSGSKVVAGKHANEYFVYATGNLTIAGITRPIDLDVSCVMVDDGSIVCSGEYKLKMKDYGLKPPVLMLGALRTGEFVTLNYSMVYRKSN